MSMHRLDRLLLDIGDTALAQVAGARDLSITGLAIDSRQIVRGDAFVALRGTQTHGIRFAPVAVQRGASVVLAEAPVPADIDTSSSEAIEGVPVVWIDHLASQVGEIAARFYGHASEAMRVVGVTGTNGKTSCVQMLAQALSFLGHRSATIGTLGAGVHGQLHEGERTTPDAVAVHRLLAEFRDAGVSHVAMEVSSHALAQHRVAAVDFDVAAFTNLTRDHLDYHGDMASYGAAKAKLFAWPSLGAAVINLDDAFGPELLAQLDGAVQPLRTSMADSADADVAAGTIVTSSNGLSFDLRTPWGAAPVKSPLLGRFNVANLLTVAACLGALGEPFERIVAALENLQPVPGRMSRLGGQGDLPLVVVDYSHTPDALDQALTALRAHCAGRLICVFGCGGERDAGKRPLMGEIAARLADVAIVTDDNPRRENGDAIVAQIVAGMPEGTTIERDRAAAIALALRDAHAGDVVLIAGKGHEPYQEDAAGKHPFDDMAVAKAALERREPRA
ncbi:UDP-N-acetylmuramoylalanyl-D-glutamate--2,6-diaminopimelate ligase [Rhodanobacter sp. Root627]|uniref:UDP-N-acetylmuramoyl-L-alanyl-D-glutamate--2, 6-diaminopimelate ligase n=1 Tax=Rhodanobacter sp. Root627 TaxID=1736572 RepID=UPI0006F8B352|nr:UDP-N-acetylmuramoyl-L-alanyl-D-glutamate--2,6-diaminopimelate ligase [Rhodanobacter sp. Root627]KRA33309.1 UDP-N-acetylmuramoylalanyl-D-glutamate--2,6-diaminopimelate ligase [Rhodanobacter sp. Root627]